MRIATWKFVRGMKRSSLLLVMMVAAESLCSSQEQAHPMRPADLLRYEKFEDFHMSPDGFRLAYVRMRPLSESKAHQATGYASLARGDVWILEIATGQKRSITDGISSETGYFAPKWSPDGERLAMLALHGHDLHVVIWDVNSGTLKELIDRNVTVGAGYPESACEWLSDQRIVCSLMPAGQPTDLSRDQNAEEYLTREWQISLKGAEPSVSEFDSGVTERLSGERKMDLGVISIEGKLIGSLPIYGIFRMAGSPDHRTLAFMERVDVKVPSGGKRLDATISGGYDNYIVSTIDENAVRSFPDLKEPRNPEPTSLRWSPTGRQFFVSSRIDNGLFRCTPSKGICERLDGGLIKGKMDEVQWTNEGDEIGFVESAAAAERPGDWWLLPASGSPTNLTKGIQVVPRSLVRLKGTDSFVGVAKGQLYRFDASAGQVKLLSSQLESADLRIEWPSTAWTDPVDAVAPGVIIVSAGSSQGSRERRRGLYAINLENGNIRRVSAPTSNARFTTYSAASEAAIFRDDSDSGTNIWTCSLAKLECNLFIDGNGFLRRITPGGEKIIHYTSLNGKDLTGRVLLPPGYEEGKRYPTVVSVYEGSAYSDDGPDPFYLRDIPGGNVDEMVNPQVLAGHGYVVLVPSMPTCPIAGICDPYFDLQDGVIPAVQKMVDLGITDNDHIGVIGFSYGGYSTYGLVTLTDRFKAAIALSGISDLSSLYGSFSPPASYSPSIQDNLNGNITMAENNQWRMGSPPWIDVGRYQRNSPISYVERVHTPLMIVQGDMEDLVLGQGEEFFSALYRQNKRAAYVRYWGENHGLDSPANILDLWHRMFAWLDEFLMKSPPPRKENPISDRAPN
jgi:dipeptidyl aminopeptidase/acylaminoacyl peptidase